MTADDLPEIDWELTTWEGSRREQLRRWRDLPLRVKLEALEEMTELSERLAAARRRRGAEVGQEAAGARWSGQGTTDHGPGRS